MFHRVKASSPKVRGAGFRLRSGRRRFHPELQGTLRTISETQFSVTLTSRMEGQASPRMYPTAESPSLGYPEGVWGWFIRIFHTFAIFHSELQGGPGSCRPTSGAFPGLDMVGVTPPGAGSHIFPLFRSELQGGRGSSRPTSGACPGLDMAGVTPPGAGSHIFPLFRSELQGGYGSSRPTSGACPGLHRVGVTPPGAGSHTLAFLDPERPGRPWGPGPTPGGAPRGGPGPFLKNVIFSTPS